MKHLQIFSLFEGSLSSYRYTFTLPKTQQEIDVINNSPEMANYIEIAKALSRYPIYSKTFPGFSFNRNGALVLNTPVGYDFKITPNGTIYYGGIQIGPSSKHSFNSVTEMLDFLSIYNVGRAYGFRINDLDKFIFDGTYPGDIIFNKLLKSSIMDEVIKIAKKYNSPDLIDSIIAKKNTSIESYVRDASLILNTEIYKYLSDIYNFTDVNIADECLTFKAGYLSPFGLFDAFLEDKPYLRSHSVCLGINGDIRVKTLRGLEKSIVPNLIELISRLDRYPLRNEPGAGDFLSVNDEMKNAIIASAKSEYTLNVSSSMIDNIIDILEKIRSNSPLKFAKIINIFKSKQMFKDVVDHFASDSEIIKGGGLLGKFGITDDEEDD